jgi:hypothetical protein
MLELFSEWNLACVSEVTLTMIIDCAIQWSIKSRPNPRKRWSRPVRKFEFGSLTDSKVNSGKPTATGSVNALLIQSIKKKKAKKKRKKDR